MNLQVSQYYQDFNENPGNNPKFCEVISLQDSPLLGFHEAKEKAPLLSKGWYELSELKRQDRIDFTEQYWLKTLPYFPSVDEKIRSFFASLDDVGVYLTKKHPSAPFECELVYSVSDGSTFFHGGPPLMESRIFQYRHPLEVILPEDYLNFFKIHNGFRKYTDTGIFKLEEVQDRAIGLRFSMDQSEMEVKLHNKLVDPSTLIPFYQSFSRDSYQVFLTSWHPTCSFGNVLLDLGEGFIADYKVKENLAFPSFLDWLVHYLEGVMC